MITPLGDNIDGKSWLTGRMNEKSLIEMLIVWKFIIWYIIYTHSTSILIALDTCQELTQVLFIHTLICFMHMWQSLMAKYFDYVTKS